MFEELKKDIYEYKKFISHLEELPEGDKIFFKEMAREELLNKKKQVIHYPAPKIEYNHTDYEEQRKKADAIIREAMEPPYW